MLEICGSLCLMVGGKVDYGKLIQSFCDYQKLSGSAVARICVLWSWISQSVIVLLHHSNLILLLPFCRPFPGNPGKCSMPIKDFVCYCYFHKLLLAVVSMQELQCQILYSGAYFPISAWGVKFRFFHRFFREGWCFVVYLFSWREKQEEETCM